MSATSSTGIGRALLGGLAAGVVAAVVNAILFAFGLIDPSIATPAGPGITLAPVVVISLVANVVGGLVLWGVLRSGRGVGLFRIIVLVVTVLSLAQPLILSGAPLAMILMLQLMHVVAAAAAWFVTPRVAGEA